jgi:hypothetical protein
MLCKWNQTLKGKPQGRYRHEIRLADKGWSKVLRAWKTLRRQPNPRVGNLWGYVATHCWENVEGEETAGKEVVGRLFS